ncbi:MAG: hypothetical protein JWL83_853 [Actinomycetia bacterium]|nr:hypothetical protein [Actinomycetes bacterium]
MTSDLPLDRASLERRLAHLASERTTLFARAGSDTGLTKADQGRLGAVERELDACFTAIREHRAARDARRFTNEQLIVRRGLKPRPDPLRP